MSLCHHDFHCNKIFVALLVLSSVFILNISLFVFVWFCQQEVGGSLYLVMEVGWFGNPFPVWSLNSEFGLISVLFVLCQYCNGGDLAEYLQSKLANYWFYWNYSTFIGYTWCVSAWLNIYNPWNAMLRVQEVEQNYCKTHVGVCTIFYGHQKHN